MGVFSFFFSRGESGRLSAVCCYLASLMCWCMLLYVRFRLALKTRKGSDARKSSCHENLFSRGTNRLILHAFVLLCHTLVVIFPAYLDSSPYQHMSEIKLVAGLSSPPHSFTFLQATLAWEETCTFALQKQTCIGTYTTISLPSFLSLAQTWVLMAP